MDYFKRAKINNVIHFNAWNIAIEKAEAPLSLNAVMLGAAVGTDMIPVEPKLIEGAIEEIVPRGAAKANLEAFQAGLVEVKKFSTFLHS